MLEEHTLLFPDYKRPQGEFQPEFKPHQLKDKPYTDPWGCVWKTSDNGITGCVYGHPLADWSKLHQYSAPSSDVTNGTFLIDWPGIEAEVKRQKAHDELVCGGLPHGHTFQRLLDIRGFENLIFDMFDEAPNLGRLIGMIEDFNYAYVMKWMALKPDIMGYPEDLGMQVGPMLSPDSFRKYIKPVFQRLMRPARELGCVIHMHSDGDIRTLVDDLVEGGVEVINLQDLVNGIDWIAGKFSGRICVELDIDRQKITTQGTPEQINDLIREEVEKIGSKQGGLMMLYDLYPGLPMENIQAIMHAMEKYATYYS